MASAKNLHHGTYNGSRGNQLHSSLEYTPELHVKMCKKIAQLTKVIYALNLKADEYEVNILALKEAHQDEINHISSETRETVLQYESKVGEEQNLRLRMHELEQTLDKNNMVMQQTLADLTMYKEQAEQREEKTKSEHAERITALSKEMLTMKTDYENQVQKLKEEADSLRKKCKVLEKDRSGEKVNEKLNKEAQALRKEVESLKSQNQKQREEYAQKTSKLHNSYIKERENLRKSLQQSVTEMLKQWQQKEQEQKKSIQAREAAMQQEVKQLKSDIDAKAQDIKESKKQSQKMKERIQVLESQLKQRRPEVQKLQAMQSQADELSNAKEQLQQQQDEIQNQIEQITTKSNTQKTAVTDLAELKSQLVEMQQKTPSKTHISKKDSGSPLNSKQSLKDYTVQKDEIVKKHIEEIGKIKRQKDEEAKRMKEQLLKSLEDQAKNHSAEIKAIQNSMEVDKITMQKDHQMQLEELKRKFESEINQLIEEREAFYLKLQETTCKDRGILQHFACSTSHTLNTKTKENSRKNKEPRNKENESCESDCCSDTEERLPTTFASNQLTSMQVENGNVLQSQEESSKKYLKPLKDKLEICEKEMSKLEKDNSVLKGSVELLSKELSVLKQEALGEKHKRAAEEELKLQQKAELELIRQSHQSEMKALMSDFNNVQAFLQAKIVSLEAELKETEDDASKHRRPEDVELINCLQDKLTCKEQVIKHLLEVQHCDNVDVMQINSETHRSQSFSCNPNAGSLTPTLKKKKIGDIPTRVISVPNLAAYDKTYMNHDFRSKKLMNPMRSSPSLDHSMKPGLPFKPPTQLLDVIRPNRRNHGNLPTKLESKEQEPKRPEWFTKYFSF
ncbi:protein FAM184B [Discoglossus pictus]